MKIRMLPAMLAMTLCTEGLMAQADIPAVAISPPVPATPPVVSQPLPSVENDPLPGVQDDSDSGGTAGVTDREEENTQDPYAEDPGVGEDDPENLADNDNTFLTPAPPESPPEVELEKQPPVNLQVTRITRLPYTITHEGSYSVTPKAVYDYLWNRNDSTAAPNALLILDPYRDSGSTSGAASASIIVDFNGTTISGCLESCDGLRLFITSGSPLPVTRGEHITIKNLTIYRGDVEIYNPAYILDYEKPQYLTLENINRGGLNQEVSRSFNVYQTTILASNITEKGEVASMEEYRGCLTMSDSRIENKEVVISDFTLNGKCSHHRLLRTNIINTLFQDKLERPFRVTNGYIDNSEFDNVIVDMNTSHDFHIGTGNMPTPVAANESLCSNRCGILDENGVLHWGFEGNEALWQANKRLE